MQIDTPIDAILVKVAAAGLRPEHHLGATLAAVSSKLHALRDTYGINVCGEGGEYETLTLDCPLFDHGRLVLDAWEAVTIADDAMAPVALLHPNSFHVEPKGTGPGGSLEATERWKVVEVADDFVAPTPPAPSKSEMSTEAGDWRAELRSIDGPVGVTLSATVQGCTSRCQTGEETIAALTSALQCIDAAMPAFSCSWGNAFFVHLYVPSMAHFAAANSAYARFLPAVNPPARATVQLAANASSALVVEVLLSRPQLGSLKKVLHVQSISEWAPSCIGPYSQAVTFRGLVHFAGQIPLDPPTMTVIQGDVAAQSVRSLKSCQAVAIAVGTDLEKAMLWCTVYTSGAAGRTGRAAAGEALDAFLLGHMQDPHAAPAENADTVGSSENGDDLDADDHVDSYLLAPQLTRHWDPVVTFVEVPELPRQVAVEIQPVAWVKDPEMEDPSSSSSDDDEEERRNRNARRRAQGAPELPAWVQKMESKKESYTLVRGRVQVASLFSPGSMLRACAAFSCVGNITTGALERAEDDILAFLQFALGDAQLRPTDVEAIKMYLTIASKDGMEQSVPQSLGMSFQEVYGLDPTVVPVLSIGLDASADAHLAVEIFARAI